MQVFVNGVIAVNKEGYDGGTCVRQDKAFNTNCSANVKKEPHTYTQQLSLLYRSVYQ